LRDVSFVVNVGEILGIAGLLGAGRTELLRTIFGSYPIEDGQIWLEGAPVQINSPREAMNLGIAYVPEDRDEAAFLGLSVRENLSAAQVERYWRHGRLQHRLEREDAFQSIREFSIRTASDQEVFSSLSGGNQQKVILARWLRREPKLLLLDEPTQGVDVGARADVYHSLRSAVDRGMAAILVSSDFKELASAADRVLVLRDGRVTAELAGPDIDSRRLTELAYLTGDRVT
jgi:ribose transport system ATP-binding protein